MYFLTLFFCFGLIFGSFYNVCIYRMPHGKSVVKPRSFCPSCGKLIPWYENIPLVSYIFLRGQCSSCGESFSFRYFFIELLTGLMFAFAFYKYGLSVKTLEFIVFTSAMIIMFFTDLDERILPDIITLGFIPVGLIFSWFVLDRTPKESFLVAIAGAGGLYLIAWLYFKIKKIEGMGMGDVKMLAMMGTFLGVRTFIALLMASLLGTIVGLILVYGMKKGKNYEIPFGCFLAIASVITYIYGGEILLYYIQHFWIQQ